MSQKVKNPDKDTLSMLDEHGHRKTIIPAEIKGLWAWRKGVVQTILLLIFLLLPWVEVDHQQSVLLDLSARHFVFFGLDLYAHDAPLIFFVVFSFFVGILLLTALWGRIWCGWACPQTVFIERVYRKLEIWIEGDYMTRRRVKEKISNSEPLTFQEQMRGLFKWMAYLGVSSLFSHSFIAYWIGSHTLVRMVLAGPQQNFVYFFLISGMTALLLFNFGWFREQFCIIACPYGRFQSTMVDAHSINVMYDEKRGEPRKGVSSALPSSGTAQGDCVNCRRCVQVCPTGIDIRNGVQMECIGCTACMDACDEIMVKVKKPVGLIRYKALTTETVKWFRPRVAAYMVVFLALVGTFVLQIFFHSNLRIEFLRAKDAPYQISQVEGVSTVRNHFILRVENKYSEPQEVLVSVDNNHKLILSENPIHLEGSQTKNIPLFFESPASEFDMYGKSFVDVEIKTAQKIKKIKAPLLGPFN